MTKRARDIRLVHAQEFNGKLMSVEKERRFSASKCTPSCNEQHFPMNSADQQPVPVF